MGGGLLDGIDFGDRLVCPALRSFHHFYLLAPIGIPWITFLGCEWGGDEYGVRDR